MVDLASWRVPERIRWPAIGAGADAFRRGLDELERTEWLSPAALEEAIFRQLDELVAFSFANIPFYRDRLGSIGYSPGCRLTPQLWQRIPLLDRVELQARGTELRAPRLPADHGGASEVLTSGSTGRPVLVLRSEFALLVWSLVTLREHLWHRRDFQAVPAAIRWFPKGDNEYPVGGHLPTWGPPVSHLFDSGPSCALSVSATSVQTAEWLGRTQPHYLVVYPSYVPELIRECRNQRITLPNLRQILTIGEPVDPELRELCLREWHAPIKDVYSANETGYIALQCPHHDHLHVQSDSLHVEILDDQGVPCRPGEVGQVVVTPLHNFAMPLIRYAIGDYAEVGPPCPCGRGLPVLKRVIGRIRNVMTLPDGRRVLPHMGELRYSEVLPVTQFQVVQKSLQDLEVRLVSARRGTTDEEDRLRQIIRSSSGGAFEIRFEYVDEIARGAGGKYEEFRSEVDGGWTYALSGFANW